MASRFWTFLIHFEVTDNSDFSDCRPGERGYVRGVVKAGDSGGLTDRVHADLQKRGLRVLDVEELERLESSRNSRLLRRLRSTALHGDEVALGRLELYPSE